MHNRRSEQWNKLNSVKLRINNYLLFLKSRKREGIYKSEGKIRTSFQKPSSQVICAIRSTREKKKKKIL